MPVSTSAADSPFAIRRTFLVDQVLSTLRGQISAGDYKEGDRLPSEADLGRQFNVGRSTIREALRVLSHLGLVETWTGKGTFVLKKDIEAKTGDAMPVREVADIYQFRYSVEPVAAEAAARDRTSEDLDRIKTANARLKEAMAHLAFEEIVERDFELHFSIVAASRNSFLTSIYEEHRDDIVRAALTLMRMANLSDNPSQDSPMALHDDLVEAIAHFDAPAAHRALRRDEREYRLLLRILEREAATSAKTELAST